MLMNETMLKLVISSIYYGRNTLKSCHFFKLDRSFTKYRQVIINITEVKENRVNKRHSSNAAICLYLLISAAI